MTPRGTLYIFVKAPRIGLSKTRLARGLGRAEARRIAGFTLARTLAAAKSSTLQSVLAIAPDSHLHANHWPRAFARFPQGAGDLTARLSRAFEAAPLGPVFFIGSDAPDLSPAHLRAAQRALIRQSAVFGPARDGGFWLFGLNKKTRTRAPFDRVRWSGPHALADVRERLGPRARIAYLETLIDIDEAQDWRDWSARARRSAGRAQL
jgi:uncharacterized protein